MDSTTDQRLPLPLLTVTTTTGDSVAVSILGFEFTDVADFEDPYYEANWLFVRVEGRSGELSTWVKDSPCLEATDIMELIHHFKALISGHKPEVYFHP